MPIYKKIIDYIEKCIKNGVYIRGGAIPSEQELCEMFQCSRMTVRKALDELVSTGILFKAQGKGAFVSTIEYDRLYSLKGFTQIMKEQGYEASSEVLSFEQVPASDEIARKLRIIEGDMVYSLARIRKASGVALSIEQVYLPAIELPDLEKYEFSTCSLYETMEREYGLRIERAVQTINTVEVTGEQAQILFQKDQRVALRSFSIGYDKNSKPIEYEIALYNGYKYSIDVIINN